MDSFDPQVPLVVSMTDFSQFKRCRKLFDFSFVRGLAPRGESNVAMQLGSDFHHLVAQAARGEALDENEMTPVARAYLETHPLPQKILYVEEPLFTLVQEAWNGRPAIYLRTTFDLVYLRAPGVYVARDYKTFAAAPSLDVDLDFQGRVYTVALQRYLSEIHSSARVEFEWEYVRRELSRPLKGKGDVEWTPEERYVNVPMVMSDLESQTTWEEIQQTALDLVRAIEEKRLYRQDLKAGPHSCSFCAYQRLCVSEYHQGALSNIDLELLAVPADPLRGATQNSILSDPRVRGVVTESPSSIFALHARIARYYGKAGVELAKKGQNSHA